MQEFKNRISQYALLNDTHWQTITELEQQKRSYLPEEDIIESGDKTDEIFIIIAGWAARYHILDDGRRQIINFMLPGDIFDLQALANLASDHSICALTNIEIIILDRNNFLEAIRNSAPIASAFWWAAVQEEAILREHITRIGRLSARERIGHLLLELNRRWMNATGSNSKTMPFPLKRSDIADALGLTSVHVSRTMSIMRRANLIDESQHGVKIKDYDALKRLSHFETDYLHERQIDLLD